MRGGGNGARVSKFFSLSIQIKKKSFFFRCVCGGGGGGGLQ